MGLGIDAVERTALVVGDLNLFGILFGRNDVASGGDDGKNLSCRGREAQDHAIRKGHIHVGGSAFSVGSDIPIEQLNMVIKLSGAANGRSVAASLICFEIDMTSRGAFDGHSPFVFREGSAPCHGVVVAYG